MSNRPAFLVDASVVMTDGARLPFGKLDLTAYLIEMRAPAYGGPREIGDAPALHQIGRHLNGEALQHARDSRLSFDSLAEAAAAFIARIGGDEAVIALRDHDTILRTAKYHVTTAEELVRDVKAAELVDGAGVTTFFRPSGDDDYFDDLNDGLGDWSYALFEQDQPWNASGSFTDFESRQDAFREWVKTWRAPAAFATRPVDWPGLEASTIREEVDNIRCDAAGELRPVDAMDRSYRNVLPGMIENALFEHHEDAIESIVDEDGLFAIYQAWLPHAGAGTPDDLALDEALKTWNDKQSITSHYPDMSRMVAADPGTTKDDVVAWAERVLARARERHAEVEGRWESPSTAAAVAQ